MSITINGTTGIAGVDGTASAPSVQGGDSNTGVFFPAADTVAITTGGAERMRVDSSGNVGIGTSSPSGAGTTLATQGAYSSIVAGSTSNANFVSFYSGQTIDPNPSILYNNDLRIGSATAPTTAGYAERFRFGSSGQIGIGGANYGTSGQVLTSGGSGAAPSWATASGVGLGQTWQTVTGSRALNTNYTNSTGKPIMVNIMITQGSGGAGRFRVDSVDVSGQQLANAGLPSMISAIVPPSSVYQMATTAGAQTITFWAELR